MFAVLDAARDPRIIARVQGYFDQKACLYAGPLGAELASAAPYLVRLYADDGFCRALLDDGWGRAWGVFVQSDTSFATLQRHLRHFLVVRDRRGQRLVFRWYDPRVLRVYLPTCTTDELREVFGPARAFLVEDVDPGVLLRYELADDGRLATTRVLLTVGGEPPVEHTSGTLTTDPAR
jgi:hypothetical protein